MKKVRDGVIDVADLDANHAVFGLITLPFFFVAVVADPEQNETIFVGFFGD
jgi:hypothetical protein